MSKPASAQGFLNKLSKKVQDKIEKKVDDKVDEQVDQNLDKVFEDDQTETAASDDEKQAERLQKMMKGFGMSGEPVDIQDDYSFDSKLHMHIESYKKNGKKDSDGEFITYIDSDGKSFAYEFVDGDMKQTNKDGLFIMDLENKAMIILTEEKGEKNGLVYGFDMQGLVDSDFNDSYAELENGEVSDIVMNPNVEKTGRTKSIEGYKCEEYHYSDPEDETEANFWISKDVNIVTRDFMSTMMKSATYSHGMPWGFVMESESVNTKTGERTLMKITDVDTNANKVLSMDGYRITNIGSMQIPNANEE